MKKISKSDSPTKMKEIEKLQETDNQYLEYLELSRDVIFTLSPDGSITYMSNAFEKITGWKLDEWIGKPFAALAHPDNIPLVMGRFSNLLTGNFSQAIEVSIKKKSGDYVYCEILGSPVIREGKVLKIIGIGRDISDRKLIEELLIKSEERYRQLFDSSPDGIVLIGTDGYILQANNEQARMYRYDSPVDLVGVHATQLVALSSRDYSAQIMSRRLNGEEIPPVEYELVRKDGTSFYGEVSASILHNEDHSVSGYICITRDTTESKLAKKALQESENKFKSAFMTSQDAIYLATLEEGLIIEINNAFEELFGYKREETIGYTSLQLNLYNNPDDRKRIVTNLKADGHIRNLEISGRKKDGELILIAMSISVLKIKNKQHIIGVLRDITKRKQEEKKLIESEIRFRTLSENEMIGVYIMKNGIMTYVNPALANIFGYEPHELIGEPPLKVIHPDDHALVTENIRRRAEGEVEKLQYEFHGLCKNGEIKNIEVIGSRASINNEIAIIGNILDITELKLAEQKIINSENQLRKVIEATSGGVWDWNVISGDAVFSPGYTSMLGYSPEEFAIAYKSWKKLVHPDDFDRVHQEHMDHFHKNKEFSIEYRMLEKSGNWHWIHSRGILIERDQQGNPLRMVGTHTDIHQRKIAENKLLEMNEQLQHAYLRQSEAIEDTQKAIAREIHDELGQSLSALMINLDWIQSNIKEPKAIERIDEMTGILSDTIIKVQKISSDLRPNLLDDLGLNAAMEFYIQEFEKRSGIKCHFKSVEIQYPNEKINITIYRLLQESLTNVMRHAKSENVHINVTQTDDLLTFEVVDDGTGFDLKKLNSINSLGLIGMRERINPFNGTMEIESLRNEGTRLIFKFPINSKIIL